MTIYKKICWIIAALILVMAFTGCGKTTTEQMSEEETSSADTQIDQKQAECLAAIKEGLEARYNISDENNKSLEGFRTYLEEALNTETAAVIKYEKEEFQDKNFENTVRKYIEALDSQYRAIEYFYTDNEKYNQLFNELGVIPRAECLRTLKEDYGLALEKKYRSTFNTAMDMEKNLYYRASLGQMIEVDTELGKLEITIEGIKKNDTWTGYEREDGQMTEDHYVATLTYSVKNISYYDEYNPGFVAFDRAITVMDQDGYSIDPEGTGYDYAGYSTAAAAFDELGQGEQKRLVTGYVLKSTDTYVEIAVGNKHSIVVPLQ